MNRFWELTLFRLTQFSFHSAKSPNKNKIFINIFLFFIFSNLFVSHSSLAGPGITYHGQILKPNSQPVEGQFVGFRIRVMDGDTGSCVMYEETHTKDMRNSNGAFAIAIGDGSVAGSYNVSSITFFDEIFKNNRTFNFLAPAGCIGAPYTPDVRDGRKLMVDFRESPTDAWEAMPVMNIAYVPFAYNSLVSRQVGDHTSGSLLRVESGGVPSAATALTPANFTELLALLNGSTTQYVKTVSGTAGQVTVSTTSGAATVGLADVATVTAGTYGSATQVPVFTVDAKGRVTSVTNTLITGAGGGITQLTGDVTASGTGSVSATIANDAITTVKILDNAVTGPKLAASAVGSAAIAEGAVTTGKLADGSVTNVKLANLSVDTAKLAADAVTSAKIQNGTITGDDLAATASLNIASVSATGNVGAETMSSRLMALYEQSVNGTDYVGLKAPDNMTTGFVVFTLPGADGTAGQVLRTDGSGNLSWFSAGTGSGDFLADGAVPMTGQLRFIPGDATTPGLGVVGDTNSGIFSPGADSLAITTGGTERLRVDASGNVGIGTTSPVAELQVSGSGFFGSDTGALPSSAGSGLRVFFDSSYDTGSLFSYDYATSTVKDLLLQAPGGRVGIGLTAPNAVLHLKAGSAAAGTAPLKLTAGTVLSTPEAGAIEFDGTSLFYTDSGNTRRTLGVAGAGITALTGDVLASGVGSAAAVIANDAITSAKILDGTIATADLADDSVTFAKFQNIASGSILGRASSSAGNVEELTLGTGLTLTGTVLSATASDTFAGLPCGNGYVPYRSAGAWGCREATASKVNDSIVSRDSSGNFIAGSGTFESSLVLKDGAVGGAITMAAPMAFTSYNLTLPSSAGSSGQVLSTDGAGVLSWMTAISSGTGFVQNGNSFGALATLGTNDNNSLVFETNNTERMRLGTNGFVGIGSSNPTATLDVGGDLNIRGRKFASSDGTHNYLLAESGAHIYFYPNNTATHMMSSNGSFGVGTLNPQTKLQVGDAADTTANFVRVAADNSSSNGVGYSFRKTSGTERFIALGDSGKLYFGSNSAGYANSDLSTAAQMTLTNAGYLGLGTRDPLVNLDVAGAMSTTSSDYSTGVVGTTFRQGVGSATGNTYGYLQAWNVGGSSYAPIILNPLGGYVGIGTTAPTQNLEIFQASGAQVQIGSEGLATTAQASLNFKTLGSSASGVGTAGTKGWHISSRGDNWGSGNYEANDLILFKADGSSFSNVMNMDFETGGVGFGYAQPSAAIHLRAGASEPGGAPFKLTTGTNLTTPEDGALEYSGSTLYFTIGSTRYPISLSGATSSYTGVSNISNSSGNITLSPVTTTGAVIIDSGTPSISTTSGALQVTGGVGITGALNVGGAITSSGDVISYGDIQTRDGKASIFYNASNNAFSAINNPGATGESMMALLTNGAERLRIDASGNIGVGIGGRYPSSRFEVAGGIDIPFATTTESYGIGYLTDSQNFDFTNAAGTYKVNHYGMTMAAMPSSAATYLSGHGELGLFTGGSNRLMIDVAGNVGIGTRTPTSLFHVYRSTNGVVANFDSPAGGTVEFTNGYISSNSALFMLHGNAAASGLSLGINGTEMMRMAASGMVGVGTSTPVGKLHLSSNTLGDQTASTDSATFPNAGTSIVGGGFVYDANYTDGTYRTRLLKVDRGGNLPLYVQQTTTVANDYVNVARFGAHQFDNNAFSVFGGASVTGNMGIGASNPVAKLHIHGNYTNDGTGGILLSATDNGNPDTYALRINPFVVAGGAVGYQFQTKSATGGTNVPLTFDHAGNVGIGTTTPGVKLDVNGAIRATSYTVKQATIPVDGNWYKVAEGSGQWCRIEYRADNASGNSPAFSSGEIYVVNDQFALMMRNKAAQYVSLGTNTNVQFARSGNSGEPGSLWVKAHGLLSTTFTILDSRNCSLFLDGTNAASPPAGGGLVIYDQLAQLSDSFFAGNGFNPAGNVYGAITLEGAYGGGLIFKDTAYAGIWAADNGQTLNFASNGTTGGFGSGANGQMVIRNSNVGIGTANPGAPLHILRGDGIARTTQLGLGAFLDQLTQPLYLFQTADIDPTFGEDALMIYSPRYQNNIFFVRGSAGGDRTYAKLYNGGGSDTIFDLTDASATTGGNTNVRLATSSDSWFNGGSLGVGNVSPESKLDVTGDIRAKAITSYDTVTGGKGTVLRYDNVGANDFGVLTAYDWGASSMKMMKISGAPLILNGALEGNVGVGTTTPQTRLQVEGVISPATDNTHTLGSGTYRFTTVYATNGTINTSDAREKKEILESVLGLDFINKLRPVSYRWKTGVDNEVHFGLIAQETEKAIEKSLGKNHSSTIVTYDQESDRYGVRYSELISPLIKAVQQLYKRILGQDQKIKSQSRDIASLKESKAETKALQEANERIKKVEAENAQLRARLDKIEKALNSK